MERAERRPPGSRGSRTRASRHHLVHLVGLLVAALLAGLLAGGAPAAGSVLAPTPGSAGMGDAYFPYDGNGGINVLSYDVHDSYAFVGKRLAGWTRLTVRATQDLSRFDLDFLLPVLSVTVDGRPAAHTRPNRHELRITPSGPIARGERFTVVVRYAGHPGRIAWEGERNWLANRSEVVAMNEPHMAPWWFPANDHPRDKALMNLRITVPNGRSVIANGRLIGRRVGARRTTVHWRADEPMAPYLAFFAAGRYSVARGSYQGLPWYVAVSDRIPPAQRRRSMRLMKRTPQIVAWLAGQLGPYPFDVTGGLTTSLDPGFALENQTRPTYPVLGGDGLTTVVHELAHQWLGDSVAVANWRDIWLNEGAATFMEARYAETHGGQSAQRWLHSWYDSLRTDTDFWNLRLADPGRAHLFDWAVYQRGGMLLQALRNRVTNVVFWQLLRTWVAQHRGGNGSSEDFVALAEQVSGQDLTGFFQAWLQDRTVPAPTAANGLG